MPNITKSIKMSDLSIQNKKKILKTLKKKYYLKSKSRRRKFVDSNDLYTPDEIEKERDLKISSLYVILSNFLNKELQGDMISFVSKEKLLESNSLSDYTTTYYTYICKHNGKSIYLSKEGR